MLYQKDYWSMDDGVLEPKTRKYHIGAATSEGRYDRKYAIECLLARDAARRTSITVVGAVVSVLSALGNLLLLLARRL